MANKENTAGPIKKIVLALLLIGPASLLLLISNKGCEHKFKELDVMGEIPAYTFVDAHGRKYTNASFKDDIVVYTTLQETCPDSCAVNMWMIEQQIYRHIRQDKRKAGMIKIVSFVTDASGKPVSDLSDMEFIMKDNINNYNPDIWILAKGDPEKVYNIERNGKNLIQGGAEFFGGKSYLELMLLSDRSNKLRMVLKGNEEGMVRTMNQHIALLKKQYDKENYKKNHTK